jgi:hypothetical protein
MGITRKPLITAAAIFALVAGLAFAGASAFARTTTILHLFAKAQTFGMFKAQWTAD